MKHSALRDLLGSSVRVIPDDTLYRCLDKLVAHKRAFFSFLRGRWETLFDVHFDVLLYDLTSTYFESDPPFAGKNANTATAVTKRSDCVQVVIALIVTPEGFPLAYEVMPGNTSDKTTLADFLERIEQQYGRSDRVWIMDRGIPTEETLTQMREREVPVHYLVGTPKGRLTRLEREFLAMPWHQVRESVDVKLLEKDEELYILARSHPRTLKERGMRQRRLKKLWQRLRELQQQKLTRDQLLIKLGAAKKEAGRAYHLVNIQLPEQDQTVHAEDFHLQSAARTSLRITRRREGRYLLRSNLRDEDPATLWQILHSAHGDRASLQRTQTRSRHPPDLSSNRQENRGAHLCRLHRLLPACDAQTSDSVNRTGAHTTGGTGKSFATIQMVDVHLPTTDGRHLVLSRFNPTKQRSPVAHAAVEAESTAATTTPNLSITPTSHRSRRRSL